MAGSTAPHTTASHGAHSLSILHVIAPSVAHLQKNALWLSGAGKMGRPFVATPMAPAPGSAAISSSWTPLGNDALLTEPEARTENDSGTCSTAGSTR